MGLDTESVGRIERNWNVVCGIREIMEKYGQARVLKNHLRLGGMLRCKRSKLLLLLLFAFIIIIIIIIIIIHVSLLLVGFMLF